MKRIKEAMALEVYEKARVRAWEAYTKYTELAWKARCKAIALASEAYEKVRRSNEKTKVG